MNSQNNSANFWKTKGNSAYQQGRYQDAIDFYTKAIEFNPRQTTYYSNRAKCYNQLKNFNQALRDSQLACQLDDQNIKAYYLWGCIFAQLSKKDSSKILEAQNKLKKALRLCDSLKKNQFTKTIDMKLKRLKKLQYLKQQQMKQQHNIQVQKLIKYSYQKGYIDQLQQANMMDMQKCYRIIKHKQIPDYMQCKITLQLMHQPVTTEAGFSYERQAISKHIQSNGNSDPMTRQPIYGKIYPNNALKQAIQHFLQENPWAFEYDPTQSYHNINF